MDILNYHIKLLDSNKFKVERKNIDWNEVLIKRDDFYKEISSIILDDKALYYFVSNNDDAKYLQESLTLKQKNKIKMVFEELFKNPENFYSNFQRERNLLAKLELIKTDIGLKEFTKKYGLKYSNKKIEFEKNKEYVQKSIKRESIYGIFGEIMLYIVIEKLLTNRNIVISKLNCITAPGTYAHGCDGIFADKLNNILYFGEAKFTIDISSSLEQALASLDDIEERIKLDENFLLLHEGSYKNGYKLEIFDDEKLKKFKKCVVVFAFHGKEYSDEEITKILHKYTDKFNNLLNSELSIELISFPIISKEELKKEISKQVTIDYVSNR